MYVYIYICMYIYIYINKKFVFDSEILLNQKE